jgi:glucosylceramidase
VQSDVPVWEGWTSSPTNPDARLSYSTGSTEPATWTLSVDPDIGKQEWRGVGAALTDASVQILSSSEDATALLFDPSRSDGAHLNWVRLPLSATDFSSTRWTFGWNDVSAQLTAPAQPTAAAAFLVDRVLPLRDDVKVVAVPWSAPADMKTPQTLDGGFLRSDSVERYGRMLIAQVDWLRSRGVPLEAMSLGNEPGFDDGNYPTMGMTDDQMVALASQVGPAANSRNVELWLVDHNWADRARYDNVLSQAPDQFAASAFHCYSGDVSQMAGVGVPPIITECTGTDDTFAGTFRWDMAHLVDGAIAAGSTGLMFWNLALDEHHGPRLGGCSNCRGVVDVHSVSGLVSPTPEFYTLAHLARAADPGAIVIDESSRPALPFVAFLNPDGDIGIVGHNDTGSRQVIAVSAAGASASTRFTVDNGSLFTLRGQAQVQSGSVSVQGPTPTVGTEVQALTSGFGPTPLMMSYQWLADGQPIDDEQGITLVPTDSQLGKRLSVRVTASRAGFALVSVTSSATAPVSADATSRVVNVSRPTVSGAPALSHVLQGSPGEWDPTPTELQWQWLSNGAPIPGETESDYAPRTADIGARISVRVTASRTGYRSSRATSPLTRPITAGSIDNLVAPTITTRAQVGATLRARPGTWSPTPDGFRYQWLVNGALISGATNRTYRPTFNTVGSTVSVRVTAVCSGWLPTDARSARTEPVAHGVIANRLRPFIVGSSLPGGRLTADPGRWRPGGLTFRYQWVRKGRPVHGATSRVFVVPWNASGHLYRVRVTATRPGYTAARSVSLPTLIVP